MPFYLQEKPLALALKKIGSVFKDAKSCLIRKFAVSFLYVCETFSRCWLFFFFYHVLPHQYEELTNNLSFQHLTPTYTLPKHPKSQMQGPSEDLGSVYHSVPFQLYMTSSFYFGVSANDCSMES